MEINTQDNIIGKQRLSFKEKKKENFIWAKRYCQHLLSKYYIDDDDYNRMLVAYRLVNNELDINDFKYECSLLNIEEPEFNDVIQPYLWIYNIISKLIGENDSKPFNHKAVLVNEEGVTSYTNRYKQLQNESFKALLEREISRAKLEYLENNPPQETGDPEKDMEMMQQYEEQMKSYINLIAEENDLLNPESIKKIMSAWQDEREISSNKLLKYYKKKLELKPMKSDSFKHGQISNCEFSWVGIEAGQPIVKLLNPLHFTYHKSPDVKFIQNGEYAYYREYATLTDTLNRYSEKMTKDDLQKLENRNNLTGSTYGKDAKMMSKDPVYQNKSFNARWYDNNKYRIDNNTGAYGDNDGHDLIEIIHFEWVSQKMVWFIEYIDEFGEIQEDMLSEEFTIPKDAKSETIKENKISKKYYYFMHPERGPIKAYKSWIPEVWTLTLIDEDIYINIGPKDESEQFRSYSDPFKVELGFKGVVYNNMNASSVSIVDRMKPFQYLYLIVMHKMKNMIALDKPPVLNIDVDELPDNMDKKEFIHFMDTAGIKFTNRLKHADNPQAANLMATTKSGTEQRSTLQFILNYYNVLNLLKRDIMLSAGVNPDRMAQVSDSQTVSGMQQNIISSSHITDYRFKIHNLHWSKLLNSLVSVILNYHRINNKDIRKRFILDDGTFANLHIQPGDYENCDIGLFVTDSGKEFQIFEHLRNSTQALIQNDKVNLSILKDMLNADSLEDLDRKIEIYEKNKEESQMRMQQMAQQHEKELKQAEIESREDQQAHEIQLKSMDIEAKMYDSQLDALKFNRTATANDVHNFVDKERERDFKVKIENDKLNKEIINDANNRSLKREEIESKERIANKNNETKLKVEDKKLKNPVPGEKIKK